MAHSDYLSHDFNHHFENPRDLQAELVGGDLDLAYVAAQAIVHELEDLCSLARGHPDDDGTDYDPVPVVETGLMICCFACSWFRKIGGGFSSVVKGVSLATTAARHGRRAVVGERQDTSMSMLLLNWLEEIGINLCALIMSNELFEAVRDRINTLMPPTEDISDWSPVEIKPWHDPIFQELMAFDSGIRATAPQCVRFLRKSLAPFSSDACLRELDEEFASATAYRRQLGLPNRPNHSTLATTPSINTGDLDSTVDIQATVLLSRHPDMSNQDIAKKLGCHPKSFSKSRTPTFARLREAFRLGKSEVRRGFVSRDGDVDGYEEGEDVG